MFTEKSKKEVSVARRRVIKEERSSRGDQRGVRPGYAEWYRPL